ncbi:uncharacterized protein LOC123452266 [Hordeum vulgare subsp. vulgare]|uniref:uncharacterized protein LOC123452266 n=1 Tax=Hordeum vulgare subsp. vulgare TaxID=112509 RepID=UPI001D1A50FD|nr:uncharacterized protein LOC123452266 [Hordeum vulgare subsp. vulgare]
MFTVSIGKTAWIRPRKTCSTCKLFKGHAKSIGENLICALLKAVYSSTRKLVKPRRSKRVAAELAGIYLKLTGIRHCMSKEAAARRNLSPSIRITASSTFTAKTRPSTGRMKQATGGLNQGGRHRRRAEQGGGARTATTGKRTRGGGQCRAQSGADDAGLLHCMHDQERAAPR